MKSTMKIICKICILFLFLYLTPFMSGLREALGDGEDMLGKLVYKQQTFDEKVSIKDQLNVLSYNSNFTLTPQDFEETPKEETPKKEDQAKDNTPSDIESAKTPTEEGTQPEQPQQNKTMSASGKKIYIYNTHQSEDYSKQATVMDAGALLTAQLQERGYTVVLETNDFHAYGNANGLDYNQSYAISYKFLNDTLANAGGFDLIIDLHRDAVPHDSCTLHANDKDYAKIMMVIGGLSSNAAQVTSLSSTITDSINKEVSGIMRNMMTREAYYNQQVHPNMVLIELGSNENTFEEVKNSIPVLAEGIAKVLG